MFLAEHQTDRQTLIPVCHTSLALDGKRQDVYNTELQRNLPIKWKENLLRHEYLTSMPKATKI